MSMINSVLSYGMFNFSQYHLKPNQFQCNRSLEPK